VRLIAAIIALVCQVGALNAADREGGSWMVYPKKNKCFDLLQFESLPYDSQRDVYTIREDQTVLLYDKFQVDGWLRGFFSARNLYYPPAGGDTTKGTTHNEWFPWIYSYCRSHPNNDLLDAATELSKTLSNSPRR
jgi:hypothetical protein